MYAVTHTVGAFHCEGYGSSYLLICMSEISDCNMGPISVYHRPIAETLEQLT